MTITTTSPAGRAFLRAHEGDPKTAYLDPVGVPTIGTGFTMRSRSCKAALAKIGITKLVPGKTKITTAQSDQILAFALADEFEPAVIKRSPANRTQPQMDAGTSVVYNLGTGAMEWNWADYWRAGDLLAAGNYLATHYNTAKRKKLPGLVRRRREEAALFLTGNYGGVGEGEPRKATPTEPKKPDPVVKEAQELLTARGFNPGAIDGWMGKKTKAAVVAYQEAHPHLVNDGIIGPATIAQLRRDAEAAKEAVTKGGGTVVSTGVTAWAAGLPWGWIVGGAAVCVGLYFAWRYRDVIARRWNTIRGKKVVV